VAIIARFGQAACELVDILVEDHDGVVFVPRLAVSRFANDKVLAAVLRLLDVEEVRAAAGGDANLEQRGTRFVVHGIYPTPGQWKW
jgi:hypothetical protein